MILDPCCGSKMFWFDTDNPDVVFGDVRRESHILCDGRSLEIKPDLQMSYENIPFADDIFDLVVFDPPHLIVAGDVSGKTHRDLLDNLSLIRKIAWVVFEKTGYLDEIDAAIEAAEGSDA